MGCKYETFYQKYTHNVFVSISLVCHENDDHSLRICGSHALNFRSGEKHIENGYDTFSFNNFGQMNLQKDRRLFFSSGCQPFLLRNIHPFSKVCLNEIDSF